ncbi:TRAP transporter small permease [Luteimonas panaciterrae]|uniref:TRAP transporter small permease n=1 Tax=Luteimonas panaciterrae TaxID=363885 RepID=UPI001CFB8F95|nr:TRAP transporter small permease [Luteimonas panaciterrae]
MNETEHPPQDAVTPEASPGWLDHLARLATWIAGGALLAMAAVQAWQVFARYVLNASPDWTEPVALLLLNTAMMFGAAVGVRAESHFGFFIARQAAPPRIGRVMHALSRVIVAATGALLAWWGARLTADSWEVPMAGARIPEGTFYLPLCIGGVLIAVFASHRLFAGDAPAQGH